jgi:hypothetical protein
MADIYVVQGPASCGKTSIIKKVFGILDAKYQNCIKEVYLFRDARKLWLNNQHQAMLNVILKPQNLNDEKKDIKIEMQNVKGFLVGIESQGDPYPKKNPYKRLKRSLKTFSKNGCHIIFCAERTPSSGIVAQWVTSHNNRNKHNKHNIKQIFSLQKVVGTKQQQDIANHNQAQNIVNAAGL